MAVNVEETTPLINNQKLVPAAMPPTSSEKNQPRSWRYPLWYVFGDGSAEDVSAACLAWNVPVVAFGWNMRRALQRSFWRELIKIALVLGGSYLVLSLLIHGLIFSCGPLPDSKGGDVRSLHEHHHEKDDGPRRGHGPCHGMPSLASLPAECRTRVITGVSFAAVAAVAIICLSIYYAARRRQQMRLQFGIDGSFARDLLSWAFCSPCALAQETRTLMGAQVTDGVWYGPVPGAAAAQVPAAQQMV